MNILITGSRRGIGLKLAVDLSKKGHMVYATTHYKSDALRLNKKHKNNQNLIFFKLDIRNKYDREKIHELDIDILVNNAAIGESGSIAEIPINKLKNNFETNVFSSIALTQEMLKDMIKKDQGKIIFISSLSGIKPETWFGSYSSTKAALNVLVRCLRKELNAINSHIKISLILPGAYQTGFNQDKIKTKYEWLTKDSYFHKIQKSIHDKEIKYYHLIERKRLDSIIKNIIKAIEEDNHKLTYTAPIEQFIYTWFYKLFTK